MTASRNSRLPVAAALACALIAAGCGSDKEQQRPLPSDTGAALQRQLGSIEARVDAGACKDVTEGNDPNTTVVRQNIDSLPAGDVKRALQKSFDRLFRLVEEQCKPKKVKTTPKTTPAPSPTPSQPTTSTPKANTQTETTQTQTTTTPKKPKQNRGKGNTNQQQGSGEGGATTTGEGG